MTCLEAAIKYATEYGWAVFPVSSTTKKPLTPHGCKDAKKTVGAIKAWWRKWPDAAVGVATGSASNLIVIDEDIDEDKGLDGYASMQDWEREHGALPETVRAITGRGGAHSYYRYEGNDWGNRTGILEGVDVRGEGGYVVAPPSLHPNGTAYEWEYPPEEYEVAPVDEQVKAFLSTGKTERSERFHLPSRIEAGQRNATLYKLACSLQAQGLPDDGIKEAVRQANQNNCDEPLDDEEIESIVRSALTKKKGELVIYNDDGLPKKRDPNLAMMIGKDGTPTDRPAQTIKNAEEAIMFDDNLYGRIRLNELARAPYVYGNVPWKQHKGWREWTNLDDSNLRSYIEATYGLKSGEKAMDAFQNVAGRLSFNPVLDALEACHQNWDGGEHIKNLLPTMLGVDPDEYQSAVMHVFMYGAISRLLRPGCKFDYMPVLVGEQGCGKSTFLRFLALKSEWFNDNFSTFDSIKAIENTRGIWIAEVGELQALKKTREVESIKAFITSQIDIYRPPYGRRSEQLRRMFVLAGTTNSQNFLTDTTGNRRFLPITCHIANRHYIIQDEPERAMAEIMQAWGEAMDAVKRGKFKLALPKDAEKQAVEMQKLYTEEDARVGIVKEYLDTKAGDRVCVAELWKEALGNFSQPTRRESNEIHAIMQEFVTEWCKVGKQRCGEYGRQIAYERNMHFVNAEKVDNLPFK